MKFKFEHLGPIKEGDVELGDLTIICGRNNVGKTYVSHSIWGLLNQEKFELREFSKRLFDLTINADTINSFNQGYNSSVKSDSISFHLPLKSLNVALNLNDFTTRFVREGLQNTFNTDSNFFANTNITIELYNEFTSKGKVLFSLEENAELYQKLVSSSFSTKTRFFNLADIEMKKESDDGDIILTYTTLSSSSSSSISGITPIDVAPSILSDWISSFIFPNTKIITSERTGIALFLPSLDKKASEIAKNFTRNFHANNLKSYLAAQKKEIGLYPVYGDPIQDNIDTIRASSTNKSKSELIQKSPYLLEMLNDFIGGEFNSSDNGITFKTSDNKLIPLHVVSSSAKSLFLIEHYIKKEAKVGELLIIDEPELNLHLDNQVKMARLIAALINSGVKVLITTHSDHLIRELNNLIMLSSSKLSSTKLDEIKKDNKNISNSIIVPEKIKAYVVSKSNNCIFKMDVGEFGVSMKLFNDEINSNNKYTKDIYFSLLETCDDQ